MGGLLRKTAILGAMSGSRVEYACFYSYCCRNTENRYLAWTAKKTQMLSQEPEEIYQLIVKLDLRWFTMAWATHMHSRRSWMISAPSWPERQHTRSVEGYDRASK